jgi:hypothetical protein
LEFFGSIEQGVKGAKRNTKYVAAARIKASRRDLAFLMVKLLDDSGKELKRLTSIANTGTEWEGVRLAFNSGDAATVLVMCRYQQSFGEVGHKAAFADVRLHEPEVVIPKIASVYISPTGKNGAAGTRGEPLLRVQEGLDRATAGTTVHLLPGVYRERVVFKQGGVAKFPVTLEGEPGAILDASDPVALDWKPADDIGKGVYKTALTAPVITVTLDGKIVTILDERRVDPDVVAKILEKGKNKAALGVVPENVYTPDWAWPILMVKGVGPSAWDGVKALAIYSEKRRELFLRIQGDVDPRMRKITVAPRVPSVSIQGVDRCVVRGLTLRNGWQGVFIEGSIGSVVEDCRIQTTDHGIWLGMGADRCTLRFNEISQDPYAGASPKMKGWWDNWLAHKVGGFYDRIGIEIRKTVGGHEVHDNFIHDHWDGIEDGGGAGENVGLRIHHNKVLRVADDGLEPNGAEEDARWHDNHVEETCCGFRIKTIRVGPLYAYRNLFIDNGEDFRCFVPQYPAKVYVYQNTSTASSALTYNKVQGIGTPNYFVHNNLFWCERWWSGGDLKPNWQGDHNVFVRRGERPEWGKTRDLAKELGIDQKSLWLETGDPGFVDFNGKDLRLKDGSPARARGEDLVKLLGFPLPGFEPGAWRGAKPDDGRSSNLTAAARGGDHAVRPDVGALQYGEAMPRLPRPRSAVRVAVAGTWPEVDERR